MGFCRFRFLRFGQTFLPPLGHFGEEKNSPISSSKKFPAVLGAIRAKAVYSETVFFADLLVIFCLIVAFVRSEKPQQPPEDNDQQ